MTNRFSETSEDIQSRLAWSVLLAGAALIAGLAGGPIFVGLGGGVLILAYLEWCTITRVAKGPAVFTLSLALAMALALISLGEGNAFQWLAGLSGFLLISGLFWPALRWRLLGLFYLSATFGAMFALRLDADGGLKAILFVAFIVWGTDVCAYLSGRLLEGPKLAPRLSPGKTWAGAIGGAVGGSLSGLTALWLLQEAITIEHLLLACGLSAAAQMGDLGESWLKRRFQVKNASNLIPGHGGMLDRIDGLLAAMFAAYCVGVARGGDAAPAAGLLSW